MEHQDLIYGRGPVLEAVRAGRDIDCVLAARGERPGRIGAVFAACRERGIPVKEVSPAKLDIRCPGQNHQGVIAIVAAFAYAGLEELFVRAKESGCPPFFVLCDGIEDPHNLGAIIRTAEASGAHGVIVPKRRSAGLTSVVAKAACGALEYLPVCRVPGLPAVMDELKERGMWLYGADMDGESWCGMDFTGPAGLIIGSEGRGLGRLVREKCDYIVSLPMAGRISSLNASVACGVLAYEVARQRAGIPARNR